MLLPPSRRLPSHEGDWLALPAAVFGGGVSGRGVCSLVESLGGEAVVYDVRSGAGAQSDFTPTSARGHRVAVYSPGFPANHRWLQTAREAGCVPVPEIDFAARFHLGPLYAVTGTNGKTSVTEFLAFALGRAGIPARAVGNNGHPLSAAAGRADGVPLVCEISSFQAENLQTLRPDAVLWTSFDEDHLDRHGSLEAYFRAKFTLVARLRSERLVISPEVAAAADTLGIRLPEFAEIVADEGADPRLAETVFARSPQRGNFWLVHAFWRMLGLPEARLFEAAQAFTLPEHRLRCIHQRDGVSYWNDSKATNFSAACAAAHAIGQPFLWIGGGKAKGGDAAGFVRQLASSLKAAFLIGETGPVVAAALAAVGVRARFFATLPEAVEAAAETATPGDSVVLSPGFASQDMFRDYGDRGKCFESAVLRLKNRHANP